MRKTKIICTIGPASSSEETIRKLLLAGMDVARLNFSHGTHESHQNLHTRLRKIAKELKRPLAILQDVQGPRIRLGKFENQGALLQPNQSFVLTCHNRLGNEYQASVQYSNFYKDVKPNDRILIADGTIQLKVVEIDGKNIITKVLVGGPVKDHNGINVPGVRLSSPSVTEKDKKDIRLGIRLGMDIIAISFVRSPEDVIQVRRMVRKAGSNCQIIAKIEHPDGVKNLDDILDSCDGIMLARGDLGVEMPPEKVPPIQKSAIIHANHRGKLVIVATQMLDSMIKNPRPTRAEASDVANAVFDSADALMLSGETASGNYPIEALQMMVQIITEAERSSSFKVANNTLDKTDSPFLNAIAKATVLAAAEVGSDFIVAFTHSGNTARIISDCRPGARILALTPKPETYHQMSIYWGVEPLLTSEVRNTDAMIRQANHLLMEYGFSQAGDIAVIVSGVPVGQSGNTNLLKLHRIRH